MSTYSNLNFIDDVEIDLIVLKEQMYSNIESVVNDNLKQIFNNLLLGYDSKNLDDLSSSQNEICNKLSLMQKNHDNNLKVLMKVKEGYLEVGNDVSKMFSDI